MATKKSFVALSSEANFVFVPGDLFQPNPMFIGKAGAYLSEAPYGAPLKRKLLALSSNIRLGWKSSQEKNTLTYYENK